MYAILELALKALIDWLTRTIAGLRAREWAETHPQANGQAPTPAVPAGVAGGPAVPAAGTPGMS